MLCKFLYLTCLVPISHYDLFLPRGSWFQVYMPTSNSFYDIIQNKLKTQDKLLSSCPNLAVCYISWHSKWATARFNRSPIRPDSYCSRLGSGFDL